MVVLNFYGKIEPTCISEKLGLYISNLPNDEYNNWRDGLAEDLEVFIKTDQIRRATLGLDSLCSVERLYKSLFKDEELPDVFQREHFLRIAEQMICVYQKYDYDDMPLGGWDTNCFDGRFCEEDYSEKIIDLINYIARLNCSLYSLPKPVPQWIYSSNHDEFDGFRLFLGGTPAEQYIPSLKEWGILFDAFLATKNDYLLFDYLANTIHKDNEYNENHLMKSYSLCQLFLEREKEMELDSKLPQFLTPVKTEEDTIRQAELFRKMRNKIAHGDFLGFEKIIETYTVEFMDGYFSFDYSEYSRKNWAIQHVCCELDDVVRKLICMLLFNKTELEKIKKST